MRLAQANWAVKAVVGAAITVIVGGIGVWVGNVNATTTRVAEMSVILPRIETKIDKNTNKLDTVSERLSHMEGRRR